MASNREQTSRECRHVGDSLSAYLDGRVTSGERALIESHLPGCTRCAEELSELRCLVDAMRSTPLVRPPRSFLLTPAMIEEKRRRSWFDLWSGFAPAAAAVAAVLLAALLFVDYQLYPSGTWLGGGLAAPAEVETVADVQAVPAVTAAAESVPEPQAVLVAPAADVSTETTGAQGTSVAAAASESATATAGNARSAAARSAPEATPEVMASVAPMVEAVPAESAAGEAPLSAQANTEQPASVPAAPPAQPPQASLAPTAAEQSAEGDAAAEEEPAAAAAVAASVASAASEPSAGPEPAASASGAAEQERLETPSFKGAPEPSTVVGPPTPTPARLAAASDESVPVADQAPEAPAAVRPLSPKAPLGLRLAQIGAGALLAAALVTWSVRLIRRRA